MTRFRMTLVAGLLVTGLMASMPAPAADDAGRYYEDALMRFDRKDDAGAIIQLKNALKADPGLLAAHLLMGRAALRNADYGVAEVALLEARNRGASRAEYILPLGNLLLVTGRQKELLESIQPADLPAGIRYEVLLLRARAHLELAQYPLAAAAVREARALNPSASAALTLQARIAIETSHPEDAATLAEQATTASPSDPDAWTMRAAAAYVVGQLPAALAHYDHVLQLSPGNREALLGRSYCLMDMGRIADAKISLNTLAASGPKDPRTFYLLAVIADSEGDKAGAKKAFSEVIALVDPLPRAIVEGRPHLLLIAGLSHLNLGTILKAREYFEIHVRTYPAQIAARKPLAAILLAQGDPASALSTLEQIPRDKRDQDVLTQMASCYSKLKRYQQATELLEQASRMGKSADVQTALGLSLMGAKQTELGLEKLRGAVMQDPGQTRASVVLALSALRDHQPKKAVELLDRLIKRDPDNLALLNLFGVALAASGDFPGARRAYEKALAGDKGFDSVKLNLARLDSIEGKPDAARARLDALIKEKPQLSAALYERALLDIGEHRTADAIRTLEALRAKNGKHGDGLVALIDLYIQTGALDQALQVAKDGSQNLPGNLAVQAALARTLLARGDKDGARATLATMTRVAEFDPVAQYKIARLQKLAGNMSGAAYSIEKALQGNPGFVPAKIMQGELFLADGAVERADARAQELLKLPSAGADVHRFAGDVAFARSQWPAAATYYRGALSRGAGADVAGFLYQSMVRAGSAAQAKAAIETLVRERPRDRALKLLLSQAQTDAGQLREARATLEAVLKEGESAPVLNNLANLQWRQKDPAAQQTAERALKLAPADPMVLDTLGWILAQNGQLDAALRHLREARLRESGNPEFRYHLAWTLAKLGRRGEARTELEGAIKQGQAFEGIEQARSLFTELSVR